MADLDRQNLAEEFDIEETEQEIETFREVLNKVKELEDPNNVLTSIIEKAGRFLDMIEHESVNGNMSARYMEVASGLIQSLIAASNSVATINSGYLEDEMKKVRVKQKDRELDQKDKELELREMYYKNKALEGKGHSGNTTNNVVITSREEVLNFLKNKDKKEEKEINPIDEEK